MARTPIKDFRADQGQTVVEKRSNRGRMPLIDEEGREGTPIKDEEVSAEVSGE
ncbi:hypothetical protein Prum_047360 [Phytohabitans rumicis]|uniref:Uncharacterized protein n=1 Tax=Phytohabitans rumicis TaxID=1076125 RepID=A0A6V8L4F5_9ACTN|nr:hypothetical protein Prum_047360 [Phytohabitans rumicis]